MNNLEKLKKAIIKEIGEQHFYPEHYNGYEDIPVRLADVLRVLGHRGEVQVASSPYAVNFYGDFYIKGKVVGQWDLTKNNLDDQSKPTIDFLTNLICKDE